MIDLSKDKNTKGRVKMVERMLGVVSKRSATRLTCPKLSLVVKSKDGNHDVEITSISSHGLRFKSEKPYNVGDKLWFDINSDEEEHPLSLSIKGKIVNEHVSGEDNHCSYGVKFHRFRFLNETESLHSYVYAIRKELLPQSPYAKLQ